MNCPLEIEFLFFRTLNSSIYNLIVNSNFVPVPVILQVQKWKQSIEIVIFRCYVVKGLFNP